MYEISIYDDPIYGLLEAIYRIHYKEWYQTILTAMLKEVISYEQAKCLLEDVPELLVYRCLEELVEGQVIKRLGNKQNRKYGLMEESNYLKGILKGLEVLS